MVNFFKKGIPFPRLTSLHYIMNPGIFGTQIYPQLVAYSEPWKVRQYLHPLSNKLQFLFEKAPGHNYLLLNVSS